MKESYEGKSGLGLVPVGRHGDAVHILHLGGVGEHLCGVHAVRHAGKAVHLRAADAVVGGH